MAKDIAKLNIKLTAENIQLKKKLDSSERRLEKFSDKAKAESAKIKSTFKNIGVGLAKGVGAGVGVAVTALSLLAKQSAAAADEVGKLSTQLGISVKTISQYQFIAGQTGVSFEKFTKAIQKAGIRVSEAAGGTGEAVQAFDELNLSAAKLEKLPLEKQFETINSRLLEVTNTTRQAYLAQLLYGKGGLDLLRTLRGTGGALNDLKAQANALGGVVDKELAQKSADAADAWDRLQTALKGVGNAIVNTLAVPFTKAIDFLTQVTIKARQAAEAMGILIAVDDIRRIKQIQKELGKLDGTLTALSNISRDTNQEYIYQEALAKRLKLYKELSNLNTQLDTEAAPLALPATGGEQGVGDNTNKTADVSADNDDPFSANFEGGGQTETDPFSDGNPIEEQFARDFELRAEHQAAELEQLQAHKDAIKGIEDASFSDLIKGKTNLLKFITKIDAKEFKLKQLSEKAKQKLIVGAGASVLGFLANHSKKAFEIQKAAGLGQAIIATATGVAEALKLPFPANLAAAAVVAAAGFSEIATIKSQSYGGGGGSTSSVPSAGAVNYSQPQLSSEIGTSDFGDIDPASTRQDLSINASDPFTANVIRDFMEKLADEGVDLGYDVTFNTAAAT